MSPPSTRFLIRTVASITLYQWKRWETNIWSQGWPEDSVNLKQSHQVVTSNQKIGSLVGSWPCLLLDLICFFKNGGVSDAKVPTLVAFLKYFGMFTPIPTWGDNPILTGAYFFKWVGSTTNYRWFFCWGSNVMPQFLQLQLICDSRPGWFWGWLPRPLRYSVHLIFVPCFWSN